MLKREDGLQIEMTKDMSASRYSSLTLFYQPLMGDSAYLLYQTLIAFVQRQIPITNHNLLMKNTHLSMQALEKARKKCEEFLLLRSYYKEDTHTYLYVLDVPMKSDRFLSHEVFGRLYLQKMGKDVVDFYKAQLKGKKVSRNDYQEISSTMKNTLQNNWDEESEKRFQNVKAEIKKMDYDFLHIIFDEKIFLSGLSLLIFPKSQRTRKNLRSIAEIATIYGINEKMMKALIKKAMILPQNVFDADRLKEVCLKTRAKYVSETKDPFTLPPRRFLEYRQNGAQLAQADVRLIEKLICEYRLQPEVINVLLETCLKRYDQKIVGSIVERMAGSWVRLKIDTMEKAKEQMQKELSASWKKHTANEIVQEWDHSDEEISDVEKMKMIEEIKKLRGEK